MKSYHFDPSQTFRQVRDTLADLNKPDHRNLIAKVVWETGPNASEPLTFLWDPYAERFGHQLDKEMLDRHVVDSLINDIPVEVELVEPHRPLK